MSDVNHQFSIDLKLKLRIDAKPLILLIIVIKFLLNFLSYRCTIKLLVMKLVRIKKRIFQDKN